MPGAVDDRDGPWWSAGDAEFSGATPLFERDDSTDPEGTGARSGDGPDAGRADPAGDPPHADREPGPESGDSGAGSPIMEALRLASALADWSEQTGLTDTLKALAVEAAESLSAQASTGDVEASPAPDGEGEASAKSDTGADPTTEAASRVTHLWEVPPSDDEAQPATSSCEFCPLCRGLDVMRTVQPQVAVGMAEAMASVTEALNTAVIAFTVNQRNKRNP